MNNIGTQLTRTDITAIRSRALLLEPYAAELYLAQQLALARARGEHRHAIATLEADLAAAQLAHGDVDEPS